LFWKGAPRQVLDLARSGTYTLFTSPDLLAELGEVLERQKFSTFANIIFHTSTRFARETSRPVLAKLLDFPLL
jgi:predicted nucleic acid-binding protein